MGTAEIIGKGGIEAQVVEDSINTLTGVRLVTMTLKYPRFIHSELMTHRMFTRNASSSRAIPVKTLIERVQNEPAIPIHWGADQKGMQANKENDNLIEHSPEFLTREKAWKEAREDATDWAEEFDKAGYHKQIVNRLLEPFQFMYTIVTATEWDNFFNLRFHGDAQPEIYELARCMYDAMYTSAPKDVPRGKWHLPLIESEERDSIIEKNYSPSMVSAARCARVSYTNHHGERDIEKDVSLANRLYNEGHMCPFEHQATPVPTDVGNNNPMSRFANMQSLTDYSRWCNNFREWSQSRYLLNGGFDV